jgi:hypothetical protein
MAESDCKGSDRFWRTISEKPQSLGDPYLLLNRQHQELSAFGKGRVDKKREYSDSWSGCLTLVAQKASMSFRAEG